jgi:hypothetical protein
MTTLSNQTIAKPWFREPWPWLLMSGPAIVVVAGIATAWIAVKSNDGLVTDDYYKKGLAVNLTIAKSDRATELGLGARIRLTENQIAIGLSASDPKWPLPPALSVTISHPTRAGLDQTHVLERGETGYVANFRLPSAGHWLVLVEDEERTWRLLGNVRLPANGETLIGGVQSDPASQDAQAKPSEVNSVAPSAAK